MMLEWLEGFFAQVDHLLPPKYLLYGPSNGGYQMSLFASAHPERVSKLFLCSTVGFTSVPSAQDYDPYSIRVSDRVNQLPPRKLVDRMVHVRENRINAFASLIKVPKE